MKNLSFLLVLIGLTFLASCTKEPEGNNVLSIDGSQANAPDFEAGTYEPAVRFTSTQTAAFEGNNLEKVSFYLADTPANCEVRVYGNGTASSPGTLLYSEDVSSDVRANRWNEHQLSSPIAIDGEDLWIAIELVYDGTSSTIGCDSGPSTGNGDWLFTTADNVWQTYYSRTDENVNVNWNIRGITD